MVGFDLVVGVIFVVEGVYFFALYVEGRGMAVDAVDEEVLAQDGETVLDFFLVCEAVLFVHEVVDCSSVIGGFAA